MDDLKQQGIAALKSGDKGLARHYLRLALEANNDDASAWLWLSGTVESDEERLECLIEVVRILPDHLAAQKGIAALRAKGVSLSPQPEQTTPVENLPANTGLVEGEPAQPDIISEPSGEPTLESSPPPEPAIEPIEKVDSLVYPEAGPETSQLPTAEQLTERWNLLSEPGGEPPTLTGKPDEMDNRWSFLDENPTRPVEGASSSPFEDYNFLSDTGQEPAAEDEAALATKAALPPQPATPLEDWAFPAESPARQEPAISAAQPMLSGVSAAPSETTQTRVAEKVLFRSKPSMMPCLIYGLLGLIIALLAEYALFLRASAGLLWFITVLIMFLLVFVPFLWVAMDRISTTYILTTHRFIIEKGIIGHKRTAIALARVKDVILRKGLFGLGSLTLVTGDKAILAKMIGQTHSSQKQDQIRRISGL